jgi:capsule polysaccharide export protein KpsE/RkpR
MKRTLLVLLLGIACGTGAHFAWLAQHSPMPAESLAAQLAWMKTNLRLSDAQLARLKLLHEQSAPRLLALAAQVASMRGELASFEHERETTGRIDFLEFARYVEQRHALDRACLDSTRSLVAASADVMTPPQREHYLSLLEPALKPNRANALP